MQNLGQSQKFCLDKMPILKTAYDKGYFVIYLIFH